MPETHQNVTGLHPAVLSRIDGVPEQLDLLLDLAADFQHKELQILAGQSYNMIDRWRDLEQRARKARTA